MNRRLANVANDRIHALVKELKKKGEQETLVALASVLQAELSLPRSPLVNAGSLDRIMRGVLVALEDNQATSRKDYVMGHLKLGHEAMEARWK